MENEANGFSISVFLAQLLVVPLVGMLLGAVLVEFFDSASGSRGNQLAAWICYAVVGFAEGYLAGIAFPGVDSSWARGIWVLPVSLCVVMFVAESRSGIRAATSEFLFIDPYSASRGLVSGVATGPSFASCWYSIGVWASLRVHGGSI